MGSDFGQQSGGSSAPPVRAGHIRMRSRGGTGFRRACCGDYTKFRDWVLLCCDWAKIRETEGAGAMKFNVDIECTPEEARAFFGLPDVKPLQEALLSEVEDRLRATLKAMDPEAMLNTWLPATLKGFEQLQEMFLSQLGSLGKRNSSEYLTFYQALVAAAVAGRGYRSIRRAFRGSRRHGISGALPGWVD